MAEPDGLTRPAIIGWKEYLALPELGSTAPQDHTEEHAAVGQCSAWSNFQKRRPEVFHDGERVTGLDGVVPRIGASGAMIDFVVANAPQSDPRDRARG